METPLSAFIQRAFPSHSSRGKSIHFKGLKTGGKSSMILLNTCLEDNKAVASCSIHLWHCPRLHMLKIRVSFTYQRLHLSVQPLLTHTSSVEWAAKQSLNKFGEQLNVFTIHIRIVFFLVILFELKVHDDICVSRLQKYIICPHQSQMFIFGWGFVSFIMKILYGSLKITRAASSEIIYQNFFLKM